MEAFVTCIVIVVARIVDVSLGTLRTISVVRGRAVVAWILGFFEVLVWIVTMSQVLSNLQSPLYAISYAFGFATGNYCGVRLENWLAYGRQVVRIFTRKGTEMASALRDSGFRATAFDGQGRDGHVHLIFVELERRRTARVLEQAASLDPECIYMVDDTRLASGPGVVHPTPTGWRAILKKK